MQLHFRSSDFPLAFQPLVVEHDEFCIHKFITALALMWPGMIHGLQGILNSKPAESHSEDESYHNLVAHVARGLDNLGFPNGAALAQWFIGTFTPSMADTSTAVGSTSRHPYLDFVPLSWNETNGGNQDPSAHTEFPIDQESTPRPRSSTPSAAETSGAATTAPSDVHSTGSPSDMDWSWTQTGTPTLGDA
jgi:hypothetical protein